MIKDSIVNLKKSLRMTLQNVPAVVDTLIRGLDEVEDAAEEQSTYSTDERVVGKWIDGSDVYEKVVYFGALPNTTAKNVEHGIANLNKIISIDTVPDNGTYYIPIPGTLLSTTPPDTITTITVTTTHIRIETNKDRSAYLAYVVIRYTKSSASRTPENDTKNGGDDEPDVKAVEDPDIKLS